MIIIGELINSTRKAIKQAIEERNILYIQELAKKQVEAGANYIDVNAGAFVDDEEEHLLWLIDAVQAVVDVPLAIDSADPEVIQKGLMAHKGEAMINSVTAEKEKLEAIIPLIKKYNAKVIALCMDDNGMPNTAEERLVIVEKLCDSFASAGIGLGDVFLDPLVKPVSVNTSFGNEVLTTLEEINKRYQGIHTTCGLSNVSFGLPERKLLNQAFFVMCIAKGMDSVIIDPLDKKIMALLYASEVLVDRDKRCMAYLKAVRSGIANA
ncbi:methyltetrahydrofolate cobalamin methyltransferase [Desulfosporosinus youngiae]|uniref:Pterin binding enzyme n=1 Tax=Desulfosporosinus youngiae DSM 17734 TaxID=768710 RepID=H5Y5F4_9FIRM|nr:methyltetrahydrofolate cobalamin methyltransferase [Desulfosporosinus youngiae]EHQ90404.1 Pterin binding enzyme [Desulfosporosinus youngiae DSM 17734]